MTIAAAVYARKSTDQTGVQDEDRSVTRQVENGRAFAARQGWTVVDQHVFVDDGVSGAEFAARPGFLRLMNALKPRPPFGALIMSEESRLGREAIETAYALKQHVQAGVRVFFYLEGRERTLDSPTDKIMLSLTAFADELERERARQRTHDAMLRLARAGRVTGGRVFGYRNVEVPGPDGGRSHVVREVAEAEAAVVRRIFDLSESSSGFTRVSKLLNAEHAVSPRPQQERPAGWSPSTVRDVLIRELYRGEVVWNKTRKRNAWGQTDPSNRPESEWLRVPVPELRIVTDEQWTAVQARLSRIRTRLATARGDRPIVRRDVESAYLMSSFARCALCGGTLSVVSRDHGRQRAFYYGCLAFHKRGSNICSNRLVMPVSIVDEAVLRALAGDALRPEVVLAIVDAVFEEMKPATVTANVEALHADLRRLDRKIANLMGAIEQGAAVVAPLVSQLQTRQTEREGLLAAIAAAEAVEDLTVDRAAVKRKVLEKVASWRDLLTRQVAEGRQALREVLEGPLRFTPEGKSYRFEGEVATGRLVAGLITPCVASPEGGERGCSGGGAPCVASPTGFEPVFWP